MKSNNKNIGDNGEKIANKYLSDIGYEIIESNFRFKTGEIDLIGKDDDYLVFIEVKTRNSNFFGEPAEAVTRIKRFRIIRTAEIYMMRNKLYNCNFRFDVIEIMLTNKPDIFHVNLIKNAF